MASSCLVWEPSRPETLQSGLAGCQQGVGIDAESQQSGRDTCQQSLTGHLLPDSRAHVVVRQPGLPRDSRAPQRELFFRGPFYCSLVHLGLMYLKLSSKAHDLFLCVLEAPLGLGQPFPYPLPVLQTPASVITPETRRNKQWRVGPSRPSKATPFRLVSSGEGQQGSLCCLTPSTQEQLDAETSS